MTPPEPGDLPAVLAGLVGVGCDVALDATPGSGWTRLDRYAEDAPLLHAGLRLAGERFGLPDVSPMTAGWFVGDIAAAIAWPAVATLLTHSRLLVSDARDIHVPHPASGRRLTARITPTSPAGQATPQAFTAGIVTALEPIVDAAHDLTRRGRHALWGTVTDMVAAAFHRVGDHLDRRDDAKRTAELAIDHADTLVGSTNWHDVSWSRGIEHTRIRNICCLWYRAPTGDLCLTCPRIDDSDRQTILDRRHDNAWAGVSAAWHMRRRPFHAPVGPTRWSDPSRGSHRPALVLGEVAEPAHAEERPPPSGGHLRRRDRLTVDTDGAARGGVRVMDCFADRKTRTQPRLRQASRATSVRAGAVRERRVVSGDTSLPGGVPTA